MVIPYLNYIHWLVVVGMVHWGLHQDKVVGLQSYIHTPLQYSTHIIKITILSISF
jgi:hypothetical protein